MKQYFLNLFKQKSKEELLDLKIEQILDDLFHSHLSNRDVVTIVNSIKDQTIFRLEEKRKRLIDELHCVVTSINIIDNLKK